MQIPTERSAISRRFSLSALACGLVALLAGCGGGAQDFGGLTRSLNGDIGSGYNTSLGSRYGQDGSARAAAVGRGTYPMIETSFELPSVPGDPFDYEKVNVQVTIRKPDGGTVDVPAFFDGGKTWRMRFTPAAPGEYSVVKALLNRETAHEEKLEKKEWTVGGDPQPGFVRIDRGDKSRFVFDNGGRYFPVGHNQAWRASELPDIPELFAKMQEAGENWSRVWMNHWDGKNLDWPQGDKKLKPGELDLEAAKRWDSIVQAAEKNGIYFQMTLQHHGQYSSIKGHRFSNNNNANWESNPWNVKNGGFLENPEDFFTNPQARALTKRKLYYILARWGYSPGILAWELFNEVEGTDAGSGKLWDDIAMWHREMALFLREHDPYQHIIATSAPAPDNKVWETVDLMQRHGYPGDVITAMGGAPPAEAKKLGKPIFYGEFGSQDFMNDREGVSLHNGLWASLMSGMSGAAQYWAWDIVEKHNLYSHFKAASAFVTASGMANQGGLTPETLPVESSQRADLRFGPGGGWEAAAQNEFVVGGSAAPAGMEKFPAFLQGEAHRKMMPKPLTFRVTYSQAGTFAASVAKVAKAGAKMRLSVEGGKSVERDFPAAPSDSTPKPEEAILRVEVPAGAHTVTVENVGSDWAVVKEFLLSDYAPALAAPARIGKDYAIAWVYHRSNVLAPISKSDLTPASGKITLSGLKPGSYRATWWDTYAGKSLDAVDISVEKGAETASLPTPAVTRDVALYIVKASTPSEKTARGKSAKKENGEPQ